MLWRFLFNLYAFVALLSGLLLGLFGAYGACLPIWGSQVFDTALAAQPDYTHPAFWFSFVLILPSMAVGFVGSIVLLILPVAFRFPEWADVKLPPQWLRYFARGLEQHLSRSPK